MITWIIASLAVVVLGAIMSTRNDGDLTEAGEAWGRVATFGVVSAVVASATFLIRHVNAG